MGTQWRRNRNTIGRGGLAWEATKQPVIRTKHLRVKVKNWGPLAPPTPSPPGSTALVGTKMVVFQSAPVWLVRVINILRKWCLMTFYITFCFFPHASCGALHNRTECCQVQLFFFVSMHPFINLNWFNAHIIMHFVCLDWVLWEIVIVLHQVMWSFSYP